MLDRVNGKFFGLHAYILTNKGAKKFLQEVFPMEVQLDSYMSMLAQLQNIKIYSAWGICSQGGRGTTIQDVCTICNYNENLIRLLTVFVAISLVCIFAFWVRK